MPKGIYERKIGLKRRPATEETKKKMSISHIGQYVSLKTRKKLSESHKGKKPYIMTQKEVVSLGIKINHNYKQLAINIHDGKEG